MALCGNISFDAILWFCASGKSFFAGIVLLILAVLIHSRLKHKVSLYIIKFLYLVALLMIILSSTPLHPIFYLLWLCVFVGWQVIRATHKRYVSAALNLLIGISIIAMLIETPFHFTKIIPVNNILRIYVIGDSVSAGMGAKDEKTWPVLLSEELNIPVINLSVAGATVNSALKQQLPKVAGQNNLVFLIIGGNDLLNHNSPEDYEKNLMQIIQHLKASSNKVIWFELPSLPQYYSYGRIQRKLARQLNIELIPKSLLAAVFGTNGATSDGIHLTFKGHEVMAEKIEKIIKR